MVGGIVMVEFFEGEPLIKEFRKEAYKSCKKFSKRLFFCYLICISLMTVIKKND